MTDEELKAIEEWNERVPKEQAVAHIAALLAEVHRLRAEVAVDDKLLEERDRVLDAIPCPAHGRCVPYAMGEIAALHEARRILAIQRPVPPSPGDILRQHSEE